MIALAAPGVVSCIMLRVARKNKGDGMKHSMGILTLTSALALCLSACTVTVDARHTGPPPSSDAPTAGDTPAAAPTPMPTQSATAGARTTSELANILAAANYPAGMALRVVPSITLDKALAQARNLLKGVKTDPAVCAELTQSAMSRSTSGFNVALAISDPSKVPQMSVGLLSAQSSAAMDQQVRDDKAQVALCRNATMTMGGMTISAKAVEVQAGAMTPGAFTYASTVTPAGQASMVTVQTEAVVAGILIRTSVLGTDAESAAKESGALLDSAAVAVTGPNS